MPLPHVKSEFYLVAMALQFVICSCLNKLFTNLLNVFNTFLFILSDRHEIFHTFNLNMFSFQVQSNITVILHLYK